MRGPAVVTMLMFLALALIAYVQAAPRAMRQDALSLLGVAKTRPECPIGSHYSLAMHGCARAWSQPGF